MQNYFISCSLGTIDKTRLDYKKTDDNQEYFKKKDGNYSILPHYYAVFKSGSIRLSEEYSKYKWVDISSLKEFEPKIHSIERVVNDFVRAKNMIKKFDPVVI